MSRQLECELLIAGGGTGGCAAAIAACRAVEAALALAKRLRQAILKRAFEGKLVLQDPNDEPATELLARIRPQRSEEDRKTCSRKRRNSL
jgi:thioredoxin reductase